MGRWWWRHAFFFFLYVKPRRTTVNIVYGGQKNCIAIVIAMGMGREVWSEGEMGWGGGDGSEVFGDVTGRGLGIG